ncbi:hypothetical protein BDZ89DRAFT_1048068 [Hymenopellis radicata]|nr:hypothetical protein BDZ89DRAFT_1048068 [Hymenopellis radicata]
MSTGISSAFQINHRRHYRIVLNNYEDILSDYEDVLSDYEDVRTEKAGKKLKTVTLGVIGFTKRKSPTEFIHSGALEHISKFIVLMDQFFATVENAAYRNLFVIFRLKTRSFELSSAYKNTLEKVSTVSDGWSADNTKQLYLRMNMFHIKIVKKKGRNAKWSLEIAMIGFRHLEGAHDGKNLG